ncbi:MAG: hypothetical protein QW356_04710 [Candidatus Hadarchaeales archaeon]
MEELKRLKAVDARRILSRPVDPLGTEYDVVKDALAGMKTLRISERELKIPGLDRHTDLIIAAVAEFKQKKARNVMPLQFAKTDDITVEPLRPEVFGLTTYLRTGLTPGEYNIIPTGPGAQTIDTDNELIIITDLVEMQTVPRVTAVQFEVDGVLQQPIEIRKDVKISDLHIYELDYPIIADAKLDLDGKVESAGDAEITPIGVHIAIGRKIPTLVI